MVEISYSLSSDLTGHKTISGMDLDVYSELFKVI